jgi:hypothetical protein
MALASMIDYLHSAVAVAQDGNVLFDATDNARGLLTTRHKNARPVPGASPSPLAGGTPRILPIIVQKVLLWYYLVLWG